MHVDPQEIARLERELDALCLELVEQFRVAHQAGRINATTGEVKSKAFLTELGNAILEVWTPWVQRCARKAMAPEATAAAARPTAPPSRPVPVRPAAPVEVEVPF